ncbi:YjgP/YjgQ family permease [Bacteroidetes/Chlorobi group bacterium Naka2016]|nr:MAG: YjgP/YjgQ family permease [Bacteroidetes/Chlorobi group bacterium Naka2016]
MKIVKWYILRFHLGPFLFGTFLVVFLFLFQLLMRDLDKLVGKGLSFWVIVQLITLNLAWMVVLAIPMGVLFSTLMTFGNLSSTFEITAMKSGGASFYQLISPVVFISILLFGFLVWFNDRVLPDANHQAKILMFDINRKKPTFSLESGQFSTQIENYTILARKVDSLSNGLSGITIYDLSNYRQTNTISADSGYVVFIPQIEKLRFQLFNGEVLQVQPFEPRNYKKIYFKELVLLLEGKGFTLERTPEGVITRGDREMRIRDMQNIVDESRKVVEMSEKNIVRLFSTPTNVLQKIEGKTNLKEDELRELVNRDFSYLESQITTELYRLSDYESRARQYEVEIQKKYAIPFACILFALVGCPLGLISRRGNFGVSAAISLGFYIFYWACLIGGEKLADRGFISPFLSMWMGNIIVFLLGVVLLFKVNYENSTIFNQINLLFSKFINVFRRKNGV